MILGGPYWTIWDQNGPTVALRWSTLIHIGHAWFILDDLDQGGPPFSEVDLGRLKMVQTSLQ